MTSGARYRFADFTLDTGQRRLTRAGAPVELGKLTYSLLVALVEAAPNVVTHDDLVARVWNGRPTSPETLTQRIKLLSDALGDDATNPRYVGLVRGQGYRLLPVVQHVRAHESPVVALVPPADPPAASASVRWLFVRTAPLVAALLAIAAALVLAQSHFRGRNAVADGAADAPLVDAASPSVAVLPFVND